MYDFWAAKAGEKTNETRVLKKRTPNRGEGLFHHLLDIPSAA
jgi:hypothetical protein